MNSKTFYNLPFNNNFDSMDYTLNSMSSRSTFCLNTCLQGTDVNKPNLDEKAKNSEKNNKPPVISNIKTKLNSILPKTKESYYNSKKSSNSTESRESFSEKYRENYNQVYSNENMSSSDSSESYESD